MKRQVFKFNDIKGMLNDDEMKGIMGGCGTTTTWEWGQDPNGNLYWRPYGSDTWNAQKPLNEVNITAPAPNTPSNPYSYPTFNPMYTNAPSSPSQGGGGGGGSSTPGIPTTYPIAPFDIKSLLKQDYKNGIVGNGITGSCGTTTSSGYLVPNYYVFDGIFTSLVRYQASDLVASNNLVEFIGKAEGGFRSTVYTKDGNNSSNPTIGYGHKLTPEEIASGIFENRVITPDEAMELWRKDMTMANAAVRQNVTVKLTQNEFDALASFAFQQGYGNFQKSAVLNAINNNDRTEAVRLLRELTQDHNDGRYHRHNEEADLFTKGDYTYAPY